jgi:hypothetical protein
MDSVLSCGPSRFLRGLTGAPSSGRRTCQRRPPRRAARCPDRLQTPGVSGHREIVLVGPSTDEQTSAAPAGGASPARELGIRWSGPDRPPRVDERGRPAANAISHPTEEIKRCNRLRSQRTAGQRVHFAYSERTAAEDVTNSSALAEQAASCCWVWHSHIDSVFFPSHAVPKRDVARRPTQLVCAGSPPAAGCVHTRESAPGQAGPDGANTRSTDDGVNDRRG